MASFKKTIITKKGKDLLAREIAGTTNMTFTKISASDKIYADTVDLSELTGIDIVRQTVNVSAVEKIDTDKVKVTGIFNNSGLSAGYAMNTIGLYAKDSSSNEVLYSVTVANIADYMPETNGINLSTVTIELINVISNTNNILMSVDATALATAGMLKDLKTNLENNYVKNIDYATEDKHGIAKIYKKSDTENDAKKIKKYARENIGNNKEVKEGLNGQDYEQEYQNAKTYWENLIEKADHTKFVTMKDLSIILKEILQPANGNEYGIVSHDTIRSVSPKPDLSPYVPFAKGYRIKDNATEFVRANASDLWTPRYLHMYLENGDYMGAFHLNGGRAYYRVPNRNGGNWCEIMDQFDMAARDQRMDRIDTDKGNLWNRANDAWNKAHDAQINRIFEIRLAGYRQEVAYHLNAGKEKNGYVVTGVANVAGDAVLDIVEFRILQFHRNGQWLNAYFA